MLRFAYLVLAAMAVLFVGAPAARADMIVHEGHLYCAGDRALVLFDGFYRALPDLPSGFAADLLQLPPAEGGVCTLSDGRAVKVKVGYGQGFAYGVCGGDPSAYFSLWVDRKKVFSGESFFADCWFGFTRRAVLIDSATVTDCAIIAPGTPPNEAPATEERVVECVRADERLSAAVLDPREYPPDGVPYPVGKIEVTGGSDPSFCARFVVRAADQEEHSDGLTNRWGSGDTFDIAAGGITLESIVGRVSMARGKTVSTDIDNDGDKDRVYWISDDGHYFDGDYLVVAPEDPALAPLFAVVTEDRKGVDERVKLAEAGGLVVVTGAKTPYEDVRYTHFEPVVVDSTTLLWAWPTLEARLPTAILYRPGPGGTLTELCRFQRVPENF